MSPESPHFKIRLPVELKARLENSAKEQGRSLTADIVWRLEKSFDMQLTYQLLERRLDEAAELDRRLSEVRRRQEEMRAEAEEFLQGEDASAVLSRGLMEQANGELQKQIDIALRQRARIEAEVEALLDDLGQRAKASLKGTQG